MIVDAELLEDKGNRVEGQGKAGQDMEGRVREG